MQSKFGFLPLRILEHTVRETTQSAKGVIRYPMRRHIKSRAPYLNRACLHEVVSNDTMFANCKALGGFTCAQVFYGLTSHDINTYGLKSGSDLSIRCSVSTAKG